MCLGIPMLIISRDGERAIADTLGVRREIALTLLPEPWPETGEHVLVHVGYAIARVDAEAAAAAQATWLAMQQAGD